jgi:predicted helicase
VTTGSADVNRFLLGAADGAVRVIFSTYQSAKVVADGMPPGFQFTAGVFDEAHKTAGHAGAKFGSPSTTPICGSPRACS